MRPNTVTFDPTQRPQIRSATRRARVRPHPPTAMTNSSPPDSVLGFLPTVVYHSEAVIGNVRLRVVPPHWSQVQSPPAPTTATSQVQFPPPPPEFVEESNRRSRVREESARIAFASGIHIAYFSTKCPSYSPLSVLLAIAPDGVWFKLEEDEAEERRRERNKELRNLYQLCVRSSKTAVVGMDNGKTELHLVPVPGDSGDKCRFWAIAAPNGLYATCCAMLNRRNLGMILDLDETLIVANTAKSFENRIEGIRHQVDKCKSQMPSRGMLSERVGILEAEQRRYEEERAMLRQFVEGDSVVHNGEVFSASPEMVSGEMLRPVIRIPGSDIILTRINPDVKDTSVLVRLRPRWGELREYLVAEGRKRFQVFVCTMSEKEYAQEMLRLLDPGHKLISPDRVVCVKAAGKKSLSMFQCHSKMSIVIDDRLDVWDEKDRPNIYVVPAFAPYYNPNAELDPPLRTVKNTVGRARSRFFKDFGAFASKLKNLSFESETTTLPVSPSVTSYLSTAEPIDTNGSAQRPFPDGLTGPEVREILSSPSSHDDGSLQREACPEPARGWIEEDEEEGTRGGQQDEENEAESRVIVNAKLEADAAKWLGVPEPIKGLEQLREQHEVKFDYLCHTRDKEDQVFAAKVLFDGKIIGQGYGRTNKQAKSKAAKQALRSLAGPLAPEEIPEEESLPLFDAISALGTLCTMEELKLEYLEDSTSNENYAFEVEVDGRIVGRGSGQDVETAKQRAAEQALRELGSNSKDSRENKRPASTRDRSPREPEKRHKGNSGYQNKRYSPPASRKGYPRSRSLPSRR